MNNDGRYMTRREAQRAEFEDHFYAIWPDYIRRMTDQQLVNLNRDRLSDVNASFPETLLVLKAWVLQEMAVRGI